MLNIILQQQGGEVHALPPPGPIGVPWNREILITAGFSTPAEWGIAAPRPIKAIVWHDMEGYLPGAIARWNSGVAGAHLCILTDGQIVLTVRLENIAWHAGTDAAVGRTPFWKTHNINAYSVGIEIEGFFIRGYTPAQINACIRLGRWLTAKYGILTEHTMDRIEGHHLHSELSNQRLDPGPLFPIDQIIGALK